MRKMFMVDFTKDVKKYGVPLYAIELACKDAKDSFNNIENVSFDVMEKDGDIGVFVSEEDWVAIYDFGESIAAHMHTFIRGWKCANENRNGVECNSASEQWECSLCNDSGMNMKPVESPYCECKYGDDLRLVDLNEVADDRSFEDSHKYEE